MKEDLFGKVVTDVSMAGNFCSVLFTKEIKKKKKQQGFDVIWSRVLLIWQIGRREILRKAKKNQKVFRLPLFFDVNNDFNGHNQYVKLYFTSTKSRHDSF